MKIAVGKFFAAASAAVLAACQHFVAVDTSGTRPVFRWPESPGGGSVVGLTVRPVLEDCEFAGPHSPGETIWWHLAGELRPPITYGIVPKGVTEVVKARPLTADCDDWVVTITDAAMRGESAEFSP